jgi:hypothetical protein
MICARCAQPIEKGQLYQEARRFKYTESESMQSGHVDPGLWVHDSPCPNAPDTGGDIAADIKSSAIDVLSRTTRGLSRTTPGPRCRAGRPCPR